MHRPERRVERLDDIERQLVNHPRGMTTGELARVYGVDPSTIHRDIGALEGRGTGLEKQGRRWQLHHQRQLYSIKLSAYELVALLVAVRLLVRYSDERNPHVAHLLVKLADALRVRSPLVAEHLSEAGDAAEDRPARADYVLAFETFSQAWIDSRKVRLVYESFRAGMRSERVFHPYFIEPSGAGFSIYVIGYDEATSAIRTFKLDRVREAHLLDDRFERPSATALRDILGRAWGIWSDPEAAAVRLRFSPQAARRVRESVWHPTQRLEDLPDGSCIFTAEVGSLVEFTPWVRQWGADVEVLAPAELRADILRSVRAQMELYQLDRDTALE